MDPYYRDNEDSEERRHHHFHHPPRPEGSFYDGPPPGGEFPGQRFSPPEGSYFPPGGEFPGPRFPPAEGSYFNSEPSSEHYRYEAPDRHSSGEAPDRYSTGEAPDRYSTGEVPGRYSTGDSYSSYQKEPDQPAIVEGPRGQIVRIFCKGNTSFNLAVGNSGAVMVPASSDDEAQQWVKDSSFGMRVKDNYGHPAFSLVNKATRKLLKHAKQKGQQVLLTDYSADIRDDDILWTESQDFGEGFKTLRSASDTLLNLTVFEGQKKIRNGSALVLDTWHKGDHQLWRVFPVRNSGEMFQQNVEE